MSDHHLLSELLGPAAVVSAAIAYAVLWLVERPAGQPTARFIGELCGAEGGPAVLVLARPHRSRAPRRAMVRRL